jgi:hypothetical protein
MQPYFEADDPEEPTAEGAWFVDCGLSYSGPPQTVFDGLGHLEGQEVAIFAGGCEFPRQIVSSGRVTLPVARGDVVIGLPMRARLRSLPIEVNMPRGLSKGVTKTSNRVALHLHESQGGTIWARQGELSEIHFAGTAPYGAPRPLSCGVQNVTIDAASALELEIEIINDDAFPFTLLSMTPEADVKDS